MRNKFPPRIVYVMRSYTVPEMRGNNHVSAGFILFLQFGLMIQSSVVKVQNRSISRKYLANSL